MKIYDTSRTITPVTRTDPGYYELHYTEYRPDGTVRCRGWEDFTDARRNCQTKVYEVWTWDGKTYNKGGKRQFEPRGTYRIHGTPAELRAAYLVSICKDATPPADVSIRRIF